MSVSLAINVLVRCVKLNGQITNIFSPKMSCSAFGEQETFSLQRLDSPLKLSPKKTLHF